MAEDDRRSAARPEVEQRVEEALQQAEIARRERRYDEGIALLLDALELECRTDQVYYRLGNLYFDAGDLARAEYVYRRAIEVNPHHVNAHHNLAVVYKKTGRVHESVRFQKRAVRLQATGKIGRAFGRGEAPRFPKPLAEPGLWAEVNAKGAGSSGAACTADGAGGAGAADATDPGATGVAPEEEPLPSLSDLRDDPEFRRWGRRMAFKGLLLVAGVVVFYLIVMYFLGRYLF